MKIIGILYILLAVIICTTGTAYGQAIVKGSGVLYTNGAPTHSVNVGVDAEIAIDSAAGLWYEYNRDAVAWEKAGFRVRHLPISIAPTGAPTDKQSEIVVNDVDSLYQWRAGAWRHLNAGADPSITNEGQLGVGAGGASSSVLTSNTSGAVGVTINVAGINTISETTSANGGSITITATEVDGSVTNELQTFTNTSDATTHTVTLSNSGGSLQLAEGSNVTLTTTGTALDGVVTIAATEVDGSITNEGQLGVGAGGASSSVLTSNTSGATGVTINVGGINTISETTSANGGQITITATEVDGSVTNELQTFDNTSNATSHTVTLSNSGGSFQLVEGANVTITTTGTALDAVVTIAASGGGGSTNYQTWYDDGVAATQQPNANFVSNADIAFTLTNDGANAETEVTADIPAAAVDFSEIQNVSTGTLAGRSTAGSGSLEQITVSTGLTISGGNLTANDASATNELQTFDNTSNATSHTLTLSNSGGSLQLAEGSNVTLTTTGTALDGVVTIAATEVDGSITNEGQLGVGAGGASSSVLLSNTSGATGVTINVAGINTISETTSANGGQITITATEVDGSVTNELQTFANTSNATTHTVTLSNSGGSFQLVEGGGVTLTTTGTGSDGVVTIAATGAANSIYTASGTVFPNCVATIDPFNSMNFLMEGAEGSVFNVGDINNDVFGDGFQVNASGAQMGDIFGSSDYYVISGKGYAGNYIRTPASNLIQDATNTSWTIISGDFTFVDSRVTKSGLKYGGNYSADIRAGDRNILDVGTAKDLFVAGTNITLTPVGNTIEISASGGGSTNYQTWRDDGVAATQRANANFVSNADIAFTLTDDGANTETEVTADIPAAAVDFSEIQNVGTGTLAGRSTAGSGSLEQITVSTGLTISGGNLTANDASATNELQTFTNTSDATTHTVTLSNSGGSFQLVEGSNITITTTGTASDGIVTIAASGGGTNYQTWRDDGVAATQQPNANFVSNSDIAFTLTNDGANSETEVTADIPNGAVDLAEIQDIATARLLGNANIAPGPPIALSYTSQFEISGTTFGLAQNGAASNDIMTWNGSAWVPSTPTFDGSITNEGQLGVGAGGASSSVLTSNTSGATGVTINAAGILAISETTSSNGGSVTLTATEVDGSVTNELQTFANTSNATSHTLTLSNSGGSIQFVEGSNITITTTGTSSDGVVTIASSGGTGDINQNGNSFAAAFVIGTNDNNTVSLEQNGTTALTIGTDKNVSLMSSVAATNTITNRLILQTNSTGTAASNFGTGILFQGESSSTNDRDLASIGAFWTTATDASRTSAIRFDLSQNGGALAETMRLDRSTNTTGALSVGTTTPVVLTNNGVTSATSFTVGNSSSALTVGGSSGTVDLMRNTSNTNLPNDFDIDSRSTGTATAGFGINLNFRGESSTTNDRELAVVQAKWTTATDASRTSDLTFAAVDNTNLTVGLTIKGTGRVETAGVLRIGAVQTTPTSIIGRDANNDVAAVTLGPGLSLSSGTLSTANVISPSQITTDQDDYSPTGWGDATTVRLSFDSDINAITSFSSQTAGERKVLTNVGTSTGYIPSEHPDGTATNRVAGGVIDYILPPNESIEIQYDATTQRWRVIDQSFPIQNFGAMQKGVYLNVPTPSATQADNEYLTFATTGTGAAASAKTAAAGLSRGLSFATGTTSTGAAAGQIMRDGEIARFGDGHICFWGQMYIPVLSSGTQRYTVDLSFGLINGTVTALPDRSAFGFRYSDNLNSGKFQLYTYDVSSVQATADSGITVAANTTYNYCGCVDKSLTEARFYINGSFVGRINSNLPSTAHAGVVRQLILKSVGTTSTEIVTQNTGVLVAY